jgi:hypothetical protein
MIDFNPAGDLTTALDLTWLLVPLELLTSVFSVGDRKLFSKTPGVPLALLTPWKVLMEEAD